MALQSLSASCGVIAGLHFCDCPSCVVFKTDLSSNAHSPRSLNLGRRVRIWWRAIEVNIPFREHIPIRKGFFPSGFSPHPSQDISGTCYNRTYRNDDTHYGNKSDDCGYCSGDCRGLFIADRCPLQVCWFLVKLLDCESYATDAIVPASQYLFTIALVVRSREFGPTHVRDNAVNTARTGGLAEGLEPIASLELTGRRPVSLVGHKNREES
jgi:hypothetical protein